MQFLGIDVSEWESRATVARGLLRKHYNGSLRGEWLSGDQRLLNDLQQVDHAWSLYAGALRSTIAGGNTLDNLQVVTTPSEVQWDDKEFGDYYYNHDTADLINANTSSYSKTEQSFAQRYWAFLQDITRPDVDLAEQGLAIAALTKVAAAETDHATLVDSIDLEWRAFDQRQVSSSPPSSWISMDEWFGNGRHGRHKNELISASREIVLSAWANYLTHIQRAFHGQEGLFAAIKKFTSYRMMSVSIPRTGSNRPGGVRELYGYHIAPDYPSWLDAARAGRHQRLSFTVRHNSSQYDYSRTDIAGGVGISFGFFGIGGAAGRSTVSLNTKSEGFELHFDADVNAFSITPDDSQDGWYDSTIFDLYRDGPFVPNSPIDLKYRNGSLWGPRGFLSFRPARAIIAFAPKVSVRLDSSQYNYFRQVTSGGGGFFIGPFAIGGAAGSSVQSHVDWNDDHFSLQLFGGESRPYLLAFDSQRLF
jgi:hypothetical protein